jgi:hypothetical protein
MRGASGWDISGMEHDHGHLGRYGARLKPPRFRVLVNPNTPLRCPCRRSFGVEWPGREQPDCQSYVPMPWD